jgi:hypothetical protein
MSSFFNMKERISTCSDPEVGGFIINKNRDRRLMVVALKVADTIEGDISVRDLLGRRKIEVASDCASFTCEDTPLVLESLTTYAQADYSRLSDRRRAASLIALIQSSEVRISLDPTTSNAQNTQLVF